MSVDKKNFIETNKTPNKKQEDGNKINDITKVKDKFEDESFLQTKNNETTDDNEVVTKEDFISYNDLLMKVGKITDVNGLYSMSYNDVLQQLYNIANNAVDSGNVEEAQKMKSIFEQLNAEVAKGDTNFDSILEEVTNLVVEKIMIIQSRLEEFQAGLDALNSESDFVMKRIIEKNNDVIGDLEELIYKIDQIVKWSIERIETIQQEGTVEKNKILSTVVNFADQISLTSSRDPRFSIDKGGQADILLNLPDEIKEKYFKSLLIDNDSEVK